MDRLSREELERIAPLVPPTDTAGHMTFVRALLEGRMAGEVFVDDREAPRTAFACSGTGFYFALGAPRGDLVEPWLLELAAALPSEEPAALYATSKAWRETLDPLFPAKIVRAEYRFEGLPPAPPAAAPFGYHLVPLDVTAADMLAPEIDGWIFRIWGGADGFVESSFGTALVAGTRIVSFCAACAIGGGEAEIDVQTAPMFAERGLASLVSRAFVRECLTRGLAPAWTAAVGNEPSDRLARRLGFVPVRHMTGYPLSLETRDAAAV